MNARYIQKFLVYFFAFLGLGVVLFVGIHKLGILNVKGITDPRDELFLLTRNDIPRAAQNLTDTTTNGSFGYSAKVVTCMLEKVARSYPTTSDRIYSIFETSGNLQLVYGMLMAAGASDTSLLPEYESCKSQPGSVGERPTTDVYAWMQSEEWRVLKTALTRDQETLNRAARDSGVPVRILIGPIIGEQMRFYTSSRAVFKSYLQPNNSFIHMSQFSHGVAGMKPETAERIEQNLRNSSSVWYLGADMEHILDYDPSVTDIATARMNRISNRSDHYYPYLYAGLYLRQFMAQWRAAGYNISDRPEVLATLYNLGHNRSIPKPNPSAGGAPITVNGVTYSFGGLAYDFYWSGELQEIFPY